MTAVEAIARFLGRSVTTRNEPLAAIRWQEAPAEGALQIVLVDERPYAYLHPRRGRWACVSWDGLPPVGIVPPPSPPSSPKEEYGRAVVAEAQRQMDRPQPRSFVGVLEEALVFAASHEAFALRKLVHDATAPTFVAGVPPWDFCGPPRRYGGGVVEWGPFAHGVPDEAVKQLLALPDVTTVVLTARDASAHGPSRMVIANRD